MKRSSSCSSTSITFEEGKHFEEGMREVLAATRVMTQSLLEAPPVIPGFEGALPVAGPVTTSLLVTAISVIALAASVADDRHLPLTLAL